MPNPSDATPVYRGYRCQALYALCRILQNTSTAHLIFQPEGQEDLAIFDTAHKLREVVQVKAYGSDLTLSDFKPDKQDSFFYRVANLAKANPGLRITIAAFGTVGPELLHALTTDGQDRERVARKLSEYTYLSTADAQTLLGNIDIEPLHEETLTRIVYSTLIKSLVGVDPDSAFGLLHYWLFICAERKIKITHQDVIEQINRLGKFVTDRAAHNSQWFTTIVPLEDHPLDTEARQELANEFYRGVSTRYNHILANLDVKRSVHRERIAQEFARTRVVIVHGPSGQGKTTLALRYLHDYFPNQWRFHVQLIENKQHALSIATALAGHADAIDIPLVVYLDVSASDKDWPELVQKLAIHRNMRVLVTIREEDFNRASITGATMDFSSIPLSFEEPEARELYQSLVQQQVSAHFLSFEEAWRAFGGEGPLMEFVHLVTQGSTLRARLAAQVARLEEDVRMQQLEPKELTLLRLIAVASAFDARLHVKPLVESLELLAPKRTLQYFEREYLVRLSDDGSLAQGLHPIRSAMLCDLLTDPTLTPWVESAQACFPYIYKPDVEVFLLYTFLRRQQDTATFLKTLHAVQTDQWVAVAGITRALIWLGVREYVDKNQALIRDAVADTGQGWSGCLDIDVADAMPGESTKRWQTPAPKMSQEGRQKLAEMQARQTDKQQIFVHVRAWLARRTQQPAPPITDMDWAAMAEVLFWAGRLRVDWPRADRLDEIPFEAAVDTLPVTVLGDVTLGLFHISSTFFDTWMRTYRHRITARFRQQTQTIVLEDTGEKVTAHFIVEMGRTASSSPVSQARIEAATDRFHEEARVRIDLIRRLFPDREQYACQGYGHKLWLFNLPCDSTRWTNIARQDLPLLWLTSVNAMFRRLAERELRPPTWPEYVQLLMDLRHNVVAALQQLRRGLEQYFRRQRYGRGAKIVDMDGWKRCKQQLRYPLLLPSCVLDEWGWTDEGATDPIHVDIRERTPLLGKYSVAFQAYKPFLDTLRSYTTPLCNFFHQSTDVMLINPLLGRNAPDEAAKARLLGQARQSGLRTDLDHLSMHNLADAVKALPHFQREFRQILGHFVADAVLTQIEHQEQQSYTYAWHLWYCFDAQPHKLIATPQSLLDNTTAMLKHLRSALRRQLRALSTGDVQVSFTSEKVLWDLQPTLWLTIDSKNTLAVYQMLEDVMQAIRQAVRHVPDTKLRQYVLDFHWPHVVVVPLVHGKSLHATAWRWALPVLLQEGALQSWHYAQAPMPAEAMAALDISTWQDPRLEPAFKYLASTTELSFYASHIGDLLHMPDADQEGTAQLQVYIEQMSGPLGTAFQAVINAGSIIVDMFNGLSSEEQAQRPHLLFAIQTLGEMQSTLLPVNNFSGRMSMTGTDIAEWAGRLHTAREYAFVVYASWVSDILAT